jgi:glycosyltransferase involved in cell wall biosynthesis
MDEERRNETAEGEYYGTEPLRRFRVLSIQTRSLGHSTYGEVLRRSFRDSKRCELESYWLDENRTLPARILYKVLSLRSPSRWINERNLDFWLARVELAWGYTGRILAAKALRAKRFSVLHFHTQGASFCSVSLMRHIPTVISADLSVFQFGHPARLPLVWPYVPLHHMERRVFRAAHAVVFWSEWARHSAVENHNLPPEKTLVIPPGVEVDRFRIKRARTGRSPLRILFVGNDFGRKGGQELLDVFLQGFKDKAELHLVTNAPVSAEHPSIHVHRQVTPYSDEWLSLYAEADMFVLPTRGDAFGLAILEAMAAGLPIITTNISAIPEIVTDGKNGLLITPDNPDALARRVERLLNDRSLRLQMGVEARKTAAEKFSAKRHSERLEEVFATARLS